MAVIRILDMKQKRRAKQRTLLPAAVEGPKVKICSHCTAMRENVKEAVKLLGLPEEELLCVSDFAEIAKLGVMSTPSLIIDGKLVSAGKVLTVDKIMGLIIEVMSETENNRD